MNRSIIKILTMSMLVVFIGAASDAFAAGETTGRIFGYVYDANGAPLASVPLMLTGSALLLPKQRESADDGHFEFNALPPGTDYAIEAALPGFAPMRKTSIVVNLGRMTSIDLKLALTEAERGYNIDVVEKMNPIMTTDSAQSTTVMTAEKAIQTPGFHQVAGMASQVAGVGPGTKPVSRGGLSRYGKFYVDGMDTTDVTDGSITAPMNFDVVDQFEVITGGFDAQYNSLGAVTNVVTQSGGNTFKYNVNLTIGPSWMTSKNPVPGNQPGFVGTYVDSPVALPQTSFYSPVAALSGPIIKDKLWFSASGQANFSNRETLVSTPYTPQENRGTVTKTYMGRVKLTWQPTVNDKISVALNLDHNTIDNNIGSGSATLDAEQKIDRGGFIVVGNYDHSFTDNILFQLQAGITHKNTNTDPESDTGLIGHVDQNGISQFSAGSVGTDFAGNFLHESKQRLQFDPSLMVSLGKHQVKGGVQLSYQRSSQLTGITGAQRYLDRGSGGVCDPDQPATFQYCNQHIDFYNSDGLLAPQTGFGSVFSMGVHVQDRWTLNRYLTVVPGLRFDMGKLYGTNGFVTDLFGIGPRLSAVWDVKGDRKNLVSLHYGRSNDVGTIFIAQHANPALTQVVSNFTNGSFPNCQNGVPSAGCQQAGGARLFGGGSTVPSVDEVTLGVKREVSDNTAVGVDLTYRRYSNMWVDQEVNQVYDASGTQIVGYVNGTNSSVLQAMTYSGAYRDYKGIDFWVQGTPGNWDLLASYTLSFTNGTVDDYFGGLLINPRYTQFYQGPLSDDRRHTLKGSVSYHTSFGLDVGGRVQYYTGTPMWESFPNPNGSARVIRSPRGTGFANDPATGVPNLNDTSQWVELRNPSSLTVDLQASYDVSGLFHLKEPRIEIVGLFVNVFNTTEATGFTDKYSAGATNRYGTATSRAAPLQGELLLRVRN